MQSINIEFDQVRDAIYNFVNGYNKDTNSHQFGLYNYQINDNTIRLIVKRAPENYIYGNPITMYDDTVKLIKSKMLQFDGYIETDDSFIIINHNSHINIEFHIDGNFQKSVERCKTCTRFTSINNKSVYKRHCNKYH
jgi:hypothetical protein